jgi:hypothetical protein
VTADGRGVASHVGSRLLADLADVTGVPQAFGKALGGLRRRRSRHDPGRALVDVAVMLADGGEAISDLAVSRRPARSVRSGRLDRHGVAGPGQHRPGPARPDAASTRWPGNGPGWRGPNSGENCRPRLRVGGYYPGW